MECIVFLSDKKKSQSPCWVDLPLWTEDLSICLKVCTSCSAALFKVGWYVRGAFNMFNSIWPQKCYKFYQGKPLLVRTCWGRPQTAKNFWNSCIISDDVQMALAEDSGIRVKQILEHTISSVILYGPQGILKQFVILIQEFLHWRWIMCSQYNSNLLPV